MIVKYYFGSYYIIHPAYSYVFKLTQMLDGSTSIQMVVSLPVYGEDIDPNDIIIVGVMDNLKAFVAKLTS